MHHNEVMHLINNFFPLYFFHDSHWMPGTQHLAYNTCTSRSSYSYSAPLQQPAQTVSLINNSYSGFSNSISGE